ncbi:MAG: UDP-N-acetylmuramate--L-alanine ligase [Candidatus Aminicenantes bacterium]|nr:UDP-N-acetylmuramate--L-alanine ligase [Candidatus Aminicenantes bacterium]NIM78011.1 UDP-N-acetylmuramate--L-alanine ligase [Candidatus Aminicenantes bacterium]NIN17333.1 UDP-N-acetylmuramate--L-alanine ligase [Candidatus Aminicenantes bacterium]NIN41225.1 UDP-N-acetylmuramate--L-alanine ligase [Candidatus Aminicenantes bacterium]NIN83999.1 UDP-N-acetylmuramate--L-alanine ligase [Candidatus Aminicenantes bacterium]
MIELSRVKKIHFVGIGGSGMSGIAEVLHNMGFIVSGSDISESETVKRLKSMGITVFLGHSKDNINDAETLVYSSAVTRENQEVQEALTRRIPVIPRAEMLAELMRVKFAIAVAGTHGKTTTTSMIAAILTCAKKDPTFVVGGRLKIEESGAKLGKSVYLVAEADESDGSFLRLFPTLAVITNIENDHLDYYQNMENLRQAFIDFGNKVPFYGSVILNMECPESRAIISRLNKRVLTYSLSHDTFVRAEHIESSVFGVSFDLLVANQNQGRLALHVGGIHNAANALAAITAAIEIGMDIDTIKEGLNRFYLPDRRFQVLFYSPDYLVVDDYAHHPTEIKVTIDTLKSGDFKRIIAVFQPHRFTRLQILMDRFAACFNGVDLLIIAPLYSANQEEIPNVNSGVLAEKIKKSGFDQNRVIYIDSFDSIIRHLQKEVRKGDAIVFLSAGNLTHTAHEFARKMEEGLK